MRTTTIVTMGGSALLATAVLAVTFATPPDADHVLQSAAGTVSAESSVPASGPNVNDSATNPAAPDAASITSGGAVVLSASTTPPASNAPAPAPLTADQQALIDQYLAAHPGRAQRLAATAARWKTFADANPELAAELAKVAALPPAQRKGELKVWFAGHPQQKEAFQTWMKQTRQDRVERRHARRDHRQDRRERRQERRENRRDGGTATPAPTPTTSGSALTSSGSSAAQV